MARLTDTLGGRVLVGVLAVHFLLLPPLFFGLLKIVNEGEGRVFINEVRSYANFIGDELEQKPLPNLCCYPESRTLIMRTNIRTFRHCQKCGTSISGSGIVGIADEDESIAHFS